MAYDIRIFPWFAVVTSTDLTRDAVVQNYRDRILQGKRIKLYKVEFEALVAGFIDCLREADSEAKIQELCAAEIALLEEGYPRLTLASDYVPRYRQAIESAVESGILPLNEQTSHRYTHHQRVTGKTEDRFEHWALTYFKYSPEEYEALDRRQAKVNRNHQLNLKTVPVHEYLDVLASLLKARGKFAARHLAIAIAGVTGRRLGEVAARGSFQLTSHPYMLHFAGQQKHERDSYDIITLFPAQEVLSALNRFRRMPEVKALRSQQGENLRRVINKFDVQVNRECEKLLQRPGIVPVLEGKKFVSVHNLRSLWGAIATYYFCPEQQHEYAFLQHYLGHVLQSSATGNYFRFQLVDEAGELIRAKGILLPEVGELPFLGESSPAAPEATGTAAKELPTAAPAPQSARPRQPAAVPVDLQALKAEIQSQLEAELAQERDALAAQWQAFKAELSAAVESLRQQRDLYWLVQRIETLEQENQALRQEAASLQTPEAGNEALVQQLRDENQSLGTQLQEAQQTLNHFRQLLLGGPVAEQNSAPQASANAPVGASEPTPELKAPVPSRDGKASAPPVIRKLSQGRKPGRAMQRAENIFYAIQEWNHHHPDQTFAVNPGLLESLFRIHRKAAKEFCSEFQNELWEHHSEIGVENLAGHNRGKDAEALKAFVNDRL